MKILQTPINFIKNSDQKQFLRFLALFFGIITAVLIVILYIHFSTVSEMRKKIKRINTQRESTRTILEQHDRVMQQKAQVDEILEKNKNFKIKQYLPSAIAAQGLSPYNTKIGEVVEEDLNNNYQEERLDAYFSGITMKNIVDLLDALEKNERIYIKELSITKSHQSLLDVTLVVATLQQKPVS